MSVTPLKSSPDMTEAEWDTRCNLAALYRVLAYLRMTDLIYTHLSARVPGEENTFLINRYGEMFDETTASSLVKMDFEGNVIGDPGRFNMAGFNIHSGTYLARPDVNCVIHTHTRAGIAVSVMECGLLPMSQHSLTIIDEVVYHDYDGPGTLEERDAVGASCGKGDVVIMRNHGLLTMGDTIQRAFRRIYYLEQSCAIQCEVMSSGQAIRLITPEVQEATRTLHVERRKSPDFGQLEWDSMLRMLDRQGQNYRQ